MAQAIEKGIDVADVYAAALFELAGDPETRDIVRTELEELVRLQREDPGFGAFMTSTAVDDDDREKSLEKIFRGRLSDIVLNTLQIMNHHDRAALVSPLLRAFVLRLEDARGQIEVVATSAVELSAAEKVQVEQVAERLSGRKPLVEYTVDPAVIGGLTLQIGDQRYDNSIRRHLLVARGQLFERGERGLKIGVEES